MGSLQRGELWVTVSQLRGQKVYLPPGYAIVEGGHSRPPPGGSQLGKRKQPDTAVRPARARR